MTQIFAPFQQKPGELPLDAIAAICRQYDVTELAIFGSILRDDFRPDSDIDFLVTFRNNDAGPWLSKFTDMEQTLSRPLDRPVDLLDRHAVEQSDNYIRREHILSSAQVIYAAR